MKVWIYVLLLIATFISNHRSTAFQAPFRQAISKRHITSPIHMSIFSRFYRVVCANVNSILRRLEDPEKVIEQAVLDMQNDLIRVRQSYAEILATLRRMEKQKEQGLIDIKEWYRRAQLAIEKGDEELAREALTRRRIQTENVDNISKALISQSGAVTKLYSSMISLENKISEAKRQKEGMIARAKTAKTSVNVNDLLSSIDSSSSTNAFERMKEKVESLEMEAEITNELVSSNIGSNVRLEHQFKSLEGNNEVEEELLRMKKKLSKPLPVFIEHDAEFIVSKSNN